MRVFLNDDVSIGLVGRYIGYDDGSSKKYYKIVVDTPLFSFPIFKTKNKEKVEEKFKKIIWVLQKLKLAKEIKW